MADSSSSTRSGSTRQSSRIAKRLKETPSNDSTADQNVSSSATATSRTKKPPPQPSINTSTIGSSKVSIKKEEIPDPVGSTSGRVTLRGGDDTKPPPRSSRSHIKVKVEEDEAPDPIGSSSRATVKKEGNPDAIGSSSSNVKVKTEDLSESSIDDSHLHPLEQAATLKIIFSFVGDFQYRFVGGVNKTFQKSYVALYPKKVTHCGASTIERTKYCWDDIGHGNDEDQKGRYKRILFNSAARYGNIEVIKYILKLLPPIQENVSKNQKRDWRYDLGSTAAQFGQKDVLQWAITENIPYVSKDDTEICKNAIGNGHIYLFQWALAHGFEFDDDEDVAFEACRNGQLEALKFLIDNDYDVRVGAHLDETCGGCNWAAKNGHVNIVKWLHENKDSYFNGYTLETAVAGGHIPLVQYLLDNDCDWEENYTDTDICNLAALVGPLEMLQLLRSHDVTWDKDAIVAKAAERGHLDIIEWAVENGCPFTKTACQRAAGFGHLDVLKALHAMGCPWDADTTTYALNEEIYDWARINGCPVEEDKPRRKLKRSSELIGDFEDDSEDE